MHSARARSRAASLRFTCAAYARPAARQPPLTLRASPIARVQYNIEDADKSEQQIDANGHPIANIFRVPMNHVVYVTPFSGWMRKLYVRLAKRMPSTATPLEA